MFFLLSGGKSCVYHANNQFPGDSYSSCVDRRYERLVGVKSKKKRVMFTHSCALRRCYKERGGSCKTNYMIIRAIITLGEGFQQLVHQYLSTLTKKNVLESIEAYTIFPSLNSVRMIWVAIWIHVCNRVKHNLITPKR